MYKWLDKATGTILRFSYEALESFLIFSMLGRALTQSFTIGYTLPATLVILLVSYQVNCWLAQLPDAVRFKWRYLGIGGVGLAVLAGFSVHPSYGSPGRVMMSLYYIWIWMRGMSMIVAEDEPIYYAKRFLRSLGVLFFSSITVGIGSIGWYMNKLKGVLVLFCLLTVFYLVRLNLKAAYEEEDTNVLSRMRNLMLVNITAVVVIVGGLASVFLFFANIRLGWFEHAIGIALMPLLRLGTWFSDWLRFRLRDRMDDNQSFEDYMDGVGSEPGPEAHMSDPVQQYEEWGFEWMIEWGVYLLLFAIMLTFVFWMYKRMAGRRTHSEKDAWEYKESMINKAYMKRLLDDRLRTAKEALVHQLRLNQPASRTRRMYRRFLRAEARRGRTFSKHHTPNTIMEVVLDLDRVRPEVKMVTDFYNEARYREQEPDKATNEKLRQLTRSFERKK